MKILHVIFVLLLTGCSFSTAIYTSNIVAMSSEAMANHIIVEQHLRSNANVFTQDEKEFLNRTSSRVIAIRDKIASIYYSKGVDGLASGGELLVQYKQLRAYYMVAITVVEAKLIELPPTAVPDIKRQILLVKEIDSNIESLLVAEENNAKAIEAIINVLSIVAKITIAST